MRNLLKEFRGFVLRGNVVDLAVGIVIGAAFTAVVAALIASFIDPIVGLLLPGDSLSAAVWDPGKPEGLAFPYGKFLDALVVFVVTAAAIFFFVVKPVNQLMRRFKTQPEVEAPIKECNYCLSKIPAKATRCAFCTSDQTAPA